MTKYLAGVVSVIAVGVMLIAYGLLVPPTASLDAQAAGIRRAAMPPIEPMFASEENGMAANPYVISTDSGGAIRIYPARPNTVYRELAVANRYTGVQMPAMLDEVEPARTVFTDTPRRRVVERAVAKPRRNWKRTAAVIGGSSAAAAGLGALFGGKKGALIGAAIGGGASTIYETTRDR